MITKQIEIKQFIRRFSNAEAIRLWMQIKKNSAKQTPKGKKTHMYILLSDPEEIL